LLEFIVEGDGEGRGGSEKKLLPKVSLILELLNKGGGSNTD
jgi:hypothetical protein